jgi:NAD+ kinase
MAEPPLRRVAVLTKGYPPATDDVLAELGQAGMGWGVELLLPDHEWAKHTMREGRGFTRIPDEGVAAADACLVLGGDGTILRALGRLIGSGVPIVGVNFGQVGFLAALSKQTWREELPPILAGRYRVIDLTTLEARHEGRRFQAVNDVVLSRVTPRHVLQLSYEVSGAHVGEMLCDGMIVASPAGSTAYNLSCDGPLVVWDANALVLNFIAPHSLGFRPMVLRPDHVVRVRNVSPEDEAEILVDGAIVDRVCCGHSVEITTARPRARLLIKEGGSFYRNVEEKLFNRSRYAL